MIRLVFVDFDEVALLPCSSSETHLRACFCRTPKLLMERTNGQKDGHDDAGKLERLGDWKEKSEKKSEKNPDKKSEQSKRQPDATARAKPIPFVPCKHGPSNSPDTGVAAATSRPMTPTGSISRQSPRQSPHHARESSPLSSASPACGSPSVRMSSPSASSTPPPRSFGLHAALRDR